MLVVPSLVEGFGFPVLEAMVRGCPVACSTGGSLTEIAGGYAEHFSADDVRSCVEAITRALSMSDATRRAAQAHAASFTWARSARMHADVYRSITRTNSRR